MTKNLTDIDDKILTLKGTRRYAQNDILVYFIKLIFYKSLNLMTLHNRGEP